MALVTYNPSVKGFHGSVHDLVFYSIKGRNILRSKGTIKKTRSTAQKIMREAFRDAAACWKGLSIETKEPWRVYGTAQGMTGYNAFQKVNIPLLKLGRPMMIAVPGEMKPAPVQEPDNDRCREFMDSIHEMIRKANDECARASGHSARNGNVSVLTEGTEIREGLSEIENRNIARSPYRGLKSPYRGLLRSGKGEIPILPRVHQGCCATVCGPVRSAWSS